MAVLNWNGWRVWIGITGAFGPEYAGRGYGKDDLRPMALAGGSDEVLRLFIDARRCGHIELANRLLIRCQTPSGPASALTELQRLRVAALRHAVNSLDAQALYSHFCFLWLIDPC